MSPHDVQIAGRQTPRRLDAAQTPLVNVLGRRKFLRHEDLRFIPDVRICIAAIRALTGDGSPTFCWSVTATSKGRAT